MIQPEIDLELDIPIISILSLGFDCDLRQQKLLRVGEDA